MDAAYRAALVDEYAAYRRAGRTTDASQVAAVLRDQYGVEVEPAKEKAAETAAPERADQKPPEAAVDPKPRRTPRAKPGQGKDGD
ncbi:MAG TPA: hypothetical protein VIU94_43105 [Streptomyces sp.]